MVLSLQSSLAPTLRPAMATLAHDHVLKAIVKTLRSTTRRIPTTTTLATTTWSTTSRLTTRVTTTLASTTVTTSTTALPHMDPSSHVLLTLTLLVLFTLLLIGCTAVGLVAKTRWDRYRLHMMPLYQFDRDQDDLEAELLDSPEEREPVGAGKNRRDFGTCQPAPAKPQLDLL